MIYDLQQGIKETFSIKLPDVSGMDAVESLIDTIASFNPMNHFDKIFILALVMLVLL